MKSRAWILCLVLTCAVFSSCESIDPKGYIGVTETDPPQLTIDLPDSIVISDDLLVSVNAFDLFGVMNLSWHLNNDYLNVFPPENGFFTIPLSSFTKKRNLLQVSAVDAFNNLGTSEPVVVNLFQTRVKSITAGPYHTLAIRSDGRGISWGQNGGSLGVEMTKQIDGYPNLIPTVTGLKKISSNGIYNGIALTDGGEVWCWGDNVSGQLGNGLTGSNNSSNTPIHVSALSGVTDVSITYQNSIAVKSDQTVWVWGSNYYGQLANGNRSDSPIPIQVVGMDSAAKVFAGPGGYIVLKLDGSVWTWGWNASYVLGREVSEDIPQKVDLPFITDLSRGQTHCLAIDQAGHVWAWGGGGYGQLGTGTQAEITPVQVPGFSSVVAVACGETHSIVLKSDGTVWQFGRLGNTSSLTPVKVNGLTNIVSIATGYDHAIAARSDGLIFYWGYNSYRQMGGGVNSYSYITPTEGIFVTRE